MHPMCRKLKRIFLPLALLAAAMGVFEFTEFDLWLQDHFYNWEQNTWAVDKSAAVPRLLFYTGPKALLIALGGYLLLGLLLPERSRPRWLILPWPVRKAWLVVITLAVVPASIAIMKARSDIYTPASLVRYHGSKPYHHVFEPLPSGWPPNRGHGFPAGHASGGFALMSLFHAFSERRWRWAGLACGLVSGWAMGLYQMLKGAHFLSHTIVTMLIAWLVIEVLAILLKVNSSEMPKPTASRSSCDTKRPNPANG